MSRMDCFQKPLLAVDDAADDTVILQFVGPTLKPVLLRSQKR